MSTGDDECMEADEDVARIVELPKITKEYSQQNKTTVSDLSQLLTLKAPIVTRDRSDSECEFENRF